MKPTEGTHYTWSEMSPRERDALVAEKVMRIPKELISITGPIDSPYNSGILVREIEFYTTDINAAWEVVLKILGNNRLFDCDLSVSNNGNENCVIFTTDKISQAWEDTLPSAICLAALRSVGVDV